MLADTRPDFEAIPIFDMQEFNPQTTADAPFISRLREVCHHVGFFYIKNHGIDSALIQRMFALTHAFFDLPQYEKDAISIANSPHYRGYGRLGAETTLGLADYKETYDLGLEQPIRQGQEEQPYFILQGPNQWPRAKDLERLNWKKTVLEYMDLMLGVGKQLMTAISLALGFPGDYFVNNFCANSMNAYALLRLLRYPPGKGAGQEEEPQLGVGPHTDLGCLVLLLQDEVGGLQVQNCNGKWVDAPPIKDTFVVNIGEMLQIWSNNYFLATPHRVINTASRVRHSIPFFFEPNLTAKVSPLAISQELLDKMNRTPVASDHSLIYGEHMLKVYQRSFVGA